MSEDLTKAIATAMGHSICCYAVTEPDGGCDCGRDEIAELIAEALAPLIEARIRETTPRPIDQADVRPGDVLRRVDDMDYVVEGNCGDVEGHLVTNWGHAGAGPGGWLLMARAATGDEEAPR